MKSTGASSCAPTRAWRAQGGFTLIELLVVMVIVGILAAVALPTFLNQAKKSRDAGAKSDARNAVTALESCFVRTEDYRQCDATALGQEAAGIEFGGGAGQVSIQPLAADGFRVTATSQTGNHFHIEKRGGGAPVRTCDTGGVAACKAGSVPSGYVGDGTW